MDIIERNGKSYNVDYLEDFERLIYFEYPELHEAFQNIKSGFDDDMEGYKDSAEEWERIADGYRTGVEDINHLAHDMYKEFLDKKTINRKKVFDYINQIIKECNNML